TSMFLHGGWFHIIGNMWFLFVFGDNVEDILGSFKFILFYLLCGIAAGVTQMVVDPHSAIPMVGASGAISGVMGAYAILFPRAPVYLLIVLGFYITKIAVPALFVLGYWFLLQFVGAIPSLGNQGGGVAFFAHIGGFVAGAILVFFFKDRARVEERRRLLGRFRRRR
ncbi:MAG: rhomboid family intramembrane serine protease, partial [Chitinivibrionales bacterium]|nr:rhomboid family intramembrane serine protease [Chitinivibrionales bacterium]